MTMLSFLFGVSKDGIEISHFNKYLVSTYSAGHQDEPDMVLPIIKKREEELDRMKEKDRKAERKR